MKTIVLYDSQFRNTRKIAEKIAQSIDGKAYNMQYFKREQFKAISLVIVGCPIHGWRPSKPTTVFLNSLRPNSLKGKKLASFDTRIHIFFPVIQRIK